MAPKRLVRLALTLLVLAGCGGGDEDTGLSDSVEGRRRMPSCGAFVASPGGLTAEDEAVRDCFLAAFRAGEQKEVVVTQATVEGDPIVTIYRVLGPDDVELFVDSTADRFAAVPMEHRRCRTLAESGNGLLADVCSSVS